jgi:hypothetical protein
MAAAYSIFNKTVAISPRQDAMNWFASCSCSFIHTAFLNHSESKLAHIANFQCGQAYFNNVPESVEKKMGAFPMTRQTKRLARMR